MTGTWFTYKRTPRCASASILDPPEFQYSNILVADFSLTNPSCCRIPERHGPLAPLADDDPSSIPLLRTAGASSQAGNHTDRCLAFIHSFLTLLAHLRLQNSRIYSYTRLATRREGSERVPISDFLERERRRQGSIVYCSEPSRGHLRGHDDVRARLLPRRRLRPTPRRLRRLPPAAAAIIVRHLLPLPIPLPIPPQQLY